MKIAIDVGGTNTDAVLMTSDRQIICKVKVPTKHDVTASILHAIRAVLKDGSSPPAPEQIQSIVLGTTHFINGLKQQKQLARVAILRFALPFSGLIPPFSHWPKGEGSLYNNIASYAAILLFCMAVLPDHMEQQRQYDVQNLSLPLRGSAAVMQKPSSSLHAILRSIQHWSAK